LQVLVRSPPLPRRRGSTRCALDVCLASQQFSHDPITRRDAIHISYLCTIRARKCPIAFDLPVLTQHTSEDARRLRCRSRLHSRA
jgi:hypothetical protein